MKYCCSIKYQFFVRSPRSLSRVAENHKFEAAEKRYKSLADDVLEAALAHYLPPPTIRDPKHAINSNNRTDLLAMASNGPVGLCGSS